MYRAATAVRLEDDVHDEDVIGHTYSYDEVREASIGYFKGDELAADVFMKYALRDPTGVFHEKTPTDMHRRLAREFARIEAGYPHPMSEDEIFTLFSTWTVVAQGSPMAAVGNPYQAQSLSNCFVVQSPHDSYGGILKTDQEQAQIMKRRGGVGFDVSSIRPRGRATSNAARTTDGIGVFMERFSNTCREVAQGGRRGALMLTISIHHPEIRTFINIKRDRTKVTGANVSIRLTDEFMQAVKDNEKVQLRFPVEKDVEHVVEQDVDANELWNEIIEAAWDSAEPGLLFWDTVIRRSPADAYATEGFRTVSTNPCAELPLCAMDSCRLLLINLNSFVERPFTNRASFDAKRFADVTQKAQRLMDDLVDLELEAVGRIITKVEDDPEPDDVKRIELELWRGIEKMVVKGRRTGLGITALGDALAGLNMTYGTDEAIDMTGKIYKTLARGAYRSSVTLAKERGAFPAFSRELETGNEFLEQVFAADAELKRVHGKHGRRNIALLTTAPAGSVSIMTQTTSGCEPAYMLTYKRRRKIVSNDDSRVDFTDPSGDRWQEYIVYHSGFQRWMNVTGKKAGDVKESPYWNATSADIDWVKKIDMQAAAQRWVDHAISNTTNLPKEATVDVVKQVYMRGWETGCKGVTIYRDGSRSGVLVKVDAVTNGHQPGTITESHAPKRPQVVECDIHRVTVKGDAYMVLVGLYDDRPYEVFAGASDQIEIPKKSKKGFLIKNGKKDGLATYNLRIPIGDDDELVCKDLVAMFDNALYGAHTRTISLALRHGIPIKFLCEQLRKDKHSDMTSFSNVIARVLSKSYIPDGTASTDEKTCHQCGSSQLSYQSGCISCIACGWSKC